MVKNIIIAVVALIAIAGLVFPQTGAIVDSLGNKTASFWDTTSGYKVGGTTVIDSSRNVAAESFTQGGSACTLTDASGGAYVLTDAEMAACGTFAFAAGGAGQAAIALTFPATSSMALTVPNAGDCKTWFYDASALAAGTTTTMTAGAGHNIIAYTTNDDVIDGAEFAEIQMCRTSSGDVNTLVTELLHAD